MTQEFVTLPREVAEQALEAMTAAMGVGPYKHRCSDAAEALHAALEQPQRKLTTQDIADSALPGNDGMASMPSAYRAMIDAAPQPQGEQEICCKIWSVNRIDDLGKIVDSSGRLIATVYGLQAEKIVACHNSHAKQEPQNEQEPVFWYRPRSDGLYDGPLHKSQIERVRKESGGWVPLHTQPQPKREPLTEEQIAEVLLDESNGRSTGIGFKTLRAFARAIEAAHNIK